MQSHKQKATSLRPFSVHSFKQETSSLFPTCWFFQNDSTFNTRRGSNRMHKVYLRHDALDQSSVSPVHTVNAWLASFILSYWTDNLKSLSKMALYSLALSTSTKFVCSHRRSSIFSAIWKELVLRALLASAIIVVITKNMCMMMGIR